MNPALLDLLGLLGSEAPPAGATDAVRGGGGGGGKRRRHLMIRVADTERRVETARDADRALRAMREDAQRTVVREARAAVLASPSSPVLVPPRAELVRRDGVDALLIQRMQAQVDASNARLAQEYERAVIAAKAWHAKMLTDLQEEDEVRVLIAMGVL